MTNDPFSASIIPFEVPEQMRAFAERGVSQARDNYAKFKDAAETHNGAIEAVFTSASKGASAYSAKLMEFMKANTTSAARLRPGIARREVARRSVPELWTTHAASRSRPSAAQAKELGELTQKVAGRAVEPIKASASKLYKPAA